MLNLIDKSTWPVKKLGEVVDMNPSRSRTLNVTDDDIVSFVPMPSVNAETGCIDTPLDRPFGTVKKGYTYFEEGDVIFAKITPCMQNGKHAVCRNLRGCFGFGSTEFHVLRPSQDILADWLHGFLRQPSILERAAEHLTGAVGQQRLPQDYLANLEIPIPPIEAQQMLSRRLQEMKLEIRKATEASRERQDMASCIRNSVFRQVFNDVTPISASLVTLSTIGNYRWRPLRQLSRLESGHTPSRSMPEWWGGSIPWLALPDIRALDGTWAESTSERTNPDGIANSAARVLPVGTVCLSRTASVGFVTILGVEMATSQDFVNWVCGPDLDPEFLMYALMASRSYLRSLASGATHQTIYMPTVESLQILAPEIVEQCRIAKWLKEALSEADRIEKQCADELKAIEAIPAALLHQVFGGVS